MDNQKNITTHFGGVQLHIYLKSFLHKVMICFLTAQKCPLRIGSIDTSGKIVGTTANEGTRGSLVRMTPDVVYYSCADIIDTSI